MPDLHRVCEPEPALGDRRHIYRQRDGLKLSGSFRIDAFFLRRTGWLLALSVLDTGEGKNNDSWT